MARSVTCHDRPLGRRSDTLMPVSPSEEQSNVSLSLNGETEAVDDGKVAIDREVSAPGESISAENPGEGNGMEVTDGTEDEEEVSVLGVFYTIVAVIDGTLAEVEFETCEGSHGEATGAAAGR